MKKLFFLLTVSLAIMPMASKAQNARTFTYDIHFGIGTTLETVNP